jgi:hypothetical protein
LLCVVHFDGNFDLKILHLLLAVTTVDSGIQALEFLGLHEDEPTNPNQPSTSPNTHQVNHFFFMFSDSEIVSFTDFVII